MHILSRMFKKLHSGLKSCYRVVLNKLHTGLTRHCYMICCLGIEPVFGRLYRLPAAKMKALKCKPSVQFAYNYSINVLSKCSNLISHRSSKVRSSKLGTSIFEGRHIDHRSSKADTSTSEGRHTDLRRSTHRFSIVDTSTFEDRRRKHRTDSSSTNIVLHKGTPVRNV